MKFIVCAGVAVACALTMGPGVANAAAYPAKPARLIVPFPPGGAADFTARTLAQGYAERWQQQVIVDNRAGAGGVIGVQLAARAAPDGYTLLLGSSSNFATGPALTRDLPYDPIRDFAPVSLAVMVPNILVAHPSVPFKSVAELIQWAKQHPGKVSYASPGVATTSHIAGELLSRAAGIQLLHVPYKGGGVASTDVLAGHVQLLFGGISTSLPMVRVGKLRALGVTSLTRVSAASDIPTIAEAGLPGYEVVQWFSIIVPARTPAAIVRRLHDDLVATLAREDVRERFKQQGLEPTTNTPEAFGRYIRAELDKWQRLFKEAGIEAEQVR